MKLSVGTIKLQRSFFTQTLRAMVDDGLTTVQIRFTPSQAMKLSAKLARLVWKMKQPSKK